MLAFQIVSLMLATPASAPAHLEPPAPAFAPCADANAFKALEGSQCVTVTAPLNHGVHGAGEEVELFVRRFPANGERRGEVWLVAGGPGESGASLYPFLDTYRRAFPGYDLIVPDHRGTGYSSRICPAEEASSSEDGFALGGSEWGPCIGHVFSNPERAHAFTITNAALDLSGLITRYRGDGEVHVYAVSYGTQLVLRMMQAAPVELDGLVLDGLVPPDSDIRWDLSHRTQVVAEVGTTFLGAEGLAAYERLLQIAPTADWKDRIPGGDLKRFMGMLLDFPSARRLMPTLIQELTDRQTGTLERVLADLESLTDVFGAYPQSAPSLPLVMLISGSENNLRRDLTTETVAAETDAAPFTSPLAGFLVNNPLPLYAPDALWDRRPGNLPPTLVVQGSLDPKTPYAGAEAHVALLRQGGSVQLAKVEKAPHFLAFSAPECFVSIASAFVVRNEFVSVCDAGD
jgi:pimeloyl-ACP methyl ester carboxylesterase